MCNGKHLMEVQDDNSTVEVQRFPTDPADWLRTASFIKFKGKVRFCNNIMFFSKSPNGEQTSRT